MRTAIASVVLPALILTAIPTAAQAAGWRTLGRAQITRTGWRQVNVPVRTRQSVSALRLCAEQNRVRFEEVRVRFDNNRTQLLSVRSSVPRGSCSRSLWLSGSRRWISSVRVTTSQPNHHTARAWIRVQGR